MQILMCVLKYDQTRTCHAVFPTPLIQGAEGIMSFRDYAVAYNTLILPHVKDDDLLEDAFGVSSLTARGTFE